MRFGSVEEFLRGWSAPKGAVAILLAEDGYLVDESARHLRGLGFQAVVVAGPGQDALTDVQAEDAAVPAAISAPDDRTRLLNRLIPALAGRWTLIAFNGDFLFFPFSETRRIVDFTDFLGSERRRSCMTYAIDLYSDRMIADGAAPLEECFFDAEGWYGFGAEGGAADVYGGLGRRFEEYSPVTMSRVNRPALFRAAEGLRIRDDLWFEDEELNTVACPWHNNPTAALMSCRRVRRMLSHPNFRNAVETLMWPKAERFDWRAGQLMRHGFIEPGQWI